MQTCFDSSMAAVAKRLRAEAKMTSSAVHPAFNSQEVWQHQLSPEQTECKRNTESVRKLLQQSCKVDLLLQFPWSQIGNPESPMTFVGILPLVDSGDASFKLYWTKMPQIRQIRQGTGPTASGLVAAPGSRALPGWFFPQNFPSNRSEMGWNFDGSTCFTMFHLVSTTSAIAARVCAASSCELPSVIFMKLMYLEAGDWWDWWDWWDWDWKHLETMAKYGKKIAKYGKKMAKPWRMIFTAQTTGPTSIIDPGRNLEISDLERPVRQHSACPTGEMFNTLDHLWVFTTFCLHSVYCSTWQRLTPRPSNSSLSCKQHHRRNQDPIYIILIYVVVRNIFAMLLRNSWAVPRNLRWTAFLHLADVPEIQMW